MREYALLLHMSLARDPSSSARARSGFRDSGFEFRISGDGFRGSGSRIRVSGCIRVAAAHVAGQRPEFERARPVGRLQGEMKRELH